MKYTLVINQKAIIEKKLRIDIIDAAILCFIYDWANSPYSKRMSEGALLYVWISPKKICEQLPILNLKPDTVYRRLKALVKAEFLIAHPDNTATSQCWHAVTALVADMYFEKEPDKPNTVSTQTPAKTTDPPQEIEPRQTETFSVSVPKSDPSDSNIRPLGFESTTTDFNTFEGSDLNPRPLGFKSAYYNTICSNTIVSGSSVVVFGETEKKNNNNFSFSLTKEKLIEAKITARHHAWLEKNPDKVPKVPDPFPSKQKNEPEAKHSPPAPPAPATEPDVFLDAIPVLDFIKIAGRPTSRKAVEEYVRRMHLPTIQRGQDWVRNHPGLDFDQIVGLFLTYIDQSKLDTASYLISKFTWFSDDFIMGKRSLEPPKKPLAPGSPESRNALPVSEAVRQAAANRFKLPPQTHNANDEPHNPNTN